MLSNSSKFKKIHNLYLSTNYVDNNSSSYGTQRQHNFSSLDSTLPSFSTLVDKRSLNKFFDYTAGVGIDKYERKALSKVIPFKTIHNANEESVVNASSKALGILNTMGSLYNYQDVNFIKWLFEYNNNFNLGSTSDSKGDANPLLSLTRPNIIKKVLKSGDYNAAVLNDLGVSINYSFFS